MTTSSIAGDIAPAFAIGRQRDLWRTEKLNLADLALRADELREKITRGPGLCDRFRAFFSDSHRKTLDGRMAEWRKEAADTAAQIHSLLTASLRWADLSAHRKGSVTQNIDRLWLTREEKAELRGLAKAPVTGHSLQAAREDRIRKLMSAHYRREAIAGWVRDIVSGVAVQRTKGARDMATLPELSAAYRKGRAKALQELRDGLVDRLNSGESPQGLRRALAAGARSKLEEVALARLLIDLQQEAARAVKAGRELEQMDDALTDELKQVIADDRKLLDVLQQPVSKAGSLGDAASWFRYLRVSHSPAEALRIAGVSGSATSFAPWAFLAAGAHKPDEVKQITAGEANFQATNFQATNFLAANFLATNFRAMVDSNVLSGGIASWRDFNRHDYDTVSPRGALRRHIERDRDAFLDAFRAALSDTGALTDGEKAIVGFLKDAFDTESAKYKSDVLLHLSDWQGDTIKLYQDIWEKRNNQNTLQSGGTT